MGDMDAGKESLALVRAKLDEAALKAHALGENKP